MGAALLSGCHPSAPGDSASLSEAAGREIALAELSLETTGDFVQSLGARLGCEKAGHLVSRPTAPSLKTAVTRILNSREGGTVYQRIQRELWNPEHSASACQTDGATPGPDAGFESLVDAVTKLESQVGHRVGLTFVAVGGLGSYMNERGVLEEQVVRWRAKTAAEGKPVRVWQHNCSRYEANDFCAPELVRRLQELDAVQPSDVKQLYVFWGYSNGGNTVLDALLQSEDLQRKTLAVVTLGTPFGGSVIAEELRSVANWVRHRRDTDPTTFAAFRAGFDAQLSALGDGGALALLADNPETYQRAYGSLTPQRRAGFLRADLPQRKLVGPFGRDIKFLHVAGILDVARLPGLPIMTVRDDQLAIRQDSAAARQVAQLAALPRFAKYPLSDSIVALEHAVLPREMLPKGVSSELIALVNLDHSSLSLSKGLDGKDIGVPFAELVDSISEVTARRISNAQ
jgi:hypothetical protein